MLCYVMLCYLKPQSFFVNVKVTALYNVHAHCTCARTVSRDSDMNRQSVLYEAGLQGGWWWVYNRRVKGWQNSRG